MARASDVILVHGNQGTTQTYYKMIRAAQQDDHGKPIVCNEDSPRFTHLKVAMETRTSWGYYNNHTKQEPPADWGITRGEDQFFAMRMADLLVIKVPALPPEEQFYFQGFEQELSYQGKRWIRLAALYPERIDSVKFYRNGEFVDMAFEEPFYIFHHDTWSQGGVAVTGAREEWTAAITMHSGETIERHAVVEAV
ncbi:MAG: hypothetical protein E4H09_01490 [Spirochaetales bacterium]|nr:MAG: hypothetical protein E4H09_01490 [Spirochaetales bacterium]